MAIAVFLGSLVFGCGAETMPALSGLVYLQTSRLAVVAGTVSCSNGADCKGGEHCEIEEEKCWGDGGTLGHSGTRSGWCRTLPCGGSCAGGACSKDDDCAPGENCSAELKCAPFEKTRCAVCRAGCQLLQPMHVQCDVCVCDRC